MKTPVTGGPPSCFAPLRIAAAALLALLSGCACYEKNDAIAALPKDSFVSNLTGQSNTGLWNRKLGLNLKNESELMIHVDRTIAFNRLKRGDIIVFTQPGRAGFICHPVVAKGKGWVKTKGNFNAEADEWPVTEARYAGRVDLVSDRSNLNWIPVNKQGTTQRAPALSDAIGAKGVVVAKADNPEKR